MSAALKSLGMSLANKAKTNVKEPSEFCNTTKGDTKRDTSRRCNKTIRERETERGRQRDELNGDTETRNRERQRETIIPDEIPPAASKDRKRQGGRETD